MRIFAGGQKRKVQTGIAVLGLSTLAYGAVRVAYRAWHPDVTSAVHLNPRSDVDTEQGAYRLAESVVSKELRLRQFLSPVLGQIPQRGTLFDKAFQSPQVPAAAPQTPALAANTISTTPPPAAPAPETGKPAEANLESPPQAGILPFNNVDSDTNRNLASLNPSEQAGPVTSLSWFNQPAVPYFPQNTPSSTAPSRGPFLGPSTFFQPSTQVLGAPQTTLLSLHFPGAGPARAFATSVGVAFELPLVSEASEVRIVDCRVRTLNISSTNSVYIPEGTPCEALTSIQDSGGIGHVQIDSILKVLRWRPTLKHRGLFEFTFLGSNGLSFSNPAKAFVNVSLGGDLAELAELRADQTFWDAEVAERTLITPENVTALKSPSLSTANWSAFGVFSGLVAPQSWLAQILGSSLGVVWRGEVATPTDPLRTYLTPGDSSAPRLHWSLPTPSAGANQDFFLSAWMRPLAQGAAPASLLKVQNAVPGLSLELTRSTQTSGTQLEWQLVPTQGSSSLGIANATLPAPGLDFFAGVNDLSLPEHPEDPSFLGIRPSLKLNGSFGTSMPGTLPALTSQNFSISLWVNPRLQDSTAAPRAILFSARQGTNSLFDIQYDSGSHEFLFAPTNMMGSGLRVLSTGRASAADAHWYLLTIVRQGLTLKTYLDGVLRDSTAFSEPGSPLANTAVNLSLGSSSNGFQGLLHRVQIYSESLSQDQVIQNYQRIEPGKCVLPLSDASADLWNQWAILLSPSGRTSRIFWNGKPFCDLVSQAGSGVSVDSSLEAGVDFMQQEISFLRKASVPAPTSMVAQDLNLRLQVIGKAVNRDFLQNLMRFHARSDEMLPYEFNPALVLQLDDAKFRQSNAPLVWTNLARASLLAHAADESQGLTSFPTRRLPFRVAAPSASPPISAAQDFTIMGWWAFDEVAASATGVDQQIMFDADPEGNGTGVLLTRRGRDSRFDAWIGSEHLLSSPVALGVTPDGRVWHHVALVRLGNTASLYFDGVVTATGRAAAVEEVGYLTLGLSRPPLSNHPFQGRLQGLKLLNQAMTSSQIQNEFILFAPKSP